MVISGEGRFDRSSMEGKVVGEILRLCAKHTVPGFVIAGAVKARPTPIVRDLVSRFGEQKAFDDVLHCVTELTTELLVEEEELWAR